MARRIDISKMPDLLDTINNILNNGHQVELKVESLRGVCVIELHRALKNSEFTVVDSK